MTFLSSPLLLICGLITGLPFPLQVETSQLDCVPIFSMLSAGIAKRNITPPPEVKNWVTGNPYATIDDSIYVRALILDDNNQQSVIISWELVDAGESATEEVRNRISEEFKIPRHHIVVNATHNHSAPWSPVYKPGLRGKEKDSWWAIRYMPPQYDDPYYKKWMETLMEQSLAAVRSAIESMEPVTIWIGRSDVSAFVQNRRPRPAEGVVESHLPEKFNYLHDQWDPNVLGEGMHFGPVDRTMSVVSFRNREGKNVATILHLSAHAVSIYTYSEGISGDWPGETLRQVNNAIEGESIFLQGTAGDINPWRRGREAVTEMATGLTKQVLLASRFSARLQDGRLKNGRSVVGIPLTEKGKEITGLDLLSAEVQVIATGPFAIVTLPGEPMTELGMAIRERSPFPQTLVLGYSNGAGIYYVGMPGEKLRGGYETGENTNLGTDIAGRLLVEAALELLVEVFNQ